MISITQKGLIVSDNAVNVLQKEFAEKKCIVLPQLLDSKLLQMLSRKVENSEFLPTEQIFDEKNFGKGVSIKTDNLALHQINFLLNNVSFFRIVEKITGCETIRGFAGRIYRNMPDTGHQLQWHDDIERGENTRLIALSVNIGEEKFSGGLFRIREKGSNTFLREVACGNPGDAHLFLVSPALEHCVTPTTGAHARTAAAGWFTSTPYTGFKP
jgi:Rps23 Pro-64 3,4-dihydroxylase Tpa1-like proline 4-hydroxylase